MYSRITYNVKEECSSSDCDQDSSSSMEHRRVKVTNFQKWIRDYDRVYNTVTWLDSEASWHNEEKVVEKLKCKICTKYKERILEK